MNKINNKTMVFSLGIMAILAFGIMTMPAQSYGATCGIGGCNYNYSTYERVSTPRPTPVYYVNPTPVYVNPTPVSTPTVYSNTNNPNYAVAATPKTVAKAKTPSPKKVAVAKVETPPPADDTTLAASAVSADNSSFLPSGLLQWIFLAILVLLAIILAKKIYGNDKKYSPIPVKHD